MEIQQNINVLIVGIVGAIGVVTALLGLALMGAWK